MSTIFYNPWEIVRLHVRFDDFGADETAFTARPTPEVDDVKVGKSIQEACASLDKILGKAVSKLEYSDDGYTATVEVESKSFTLKENGFREADELTVTIDWRLFPCDPRIIRSIIIELHSGLLSSDDWNGGIVPKLTEKTLRFLGFTDEVEVKVGTVSELKIKSLDFTSLLMDYSLHPAITNNLDLSRPFDDVIEALVKIVPGADNLKIIWEGWSDGKPDLIKATKLLSPGGAKNKKAAAKSDESVWDYITELCLLVDVIPLIKLDTLHLWPSDILFSKRTDIIPRMVFGENIKEFELSRKLGRINVPTILVRSYDVEEGDYHAAWWPEKPRASAKLPGKKTQEVVKVFPVANVKDVKVLKKIAKGIFETLGRQSIKGRLKTHDFTGLDYEGSVKNRNSLIQVTDKNAELFNLHPGDPIIVESSASHDHSFALQLKYSGKPVDGKTQTEQVLKSKGLDDKTAKYMARALTNKQFLQVFYTTKKEIRRDNNGKWTFEIEFADYIKSDVDTSGM